MKSPYVVRPTDARRSCYGRGAAHRYSRERDEPQDIGFGDEVLLLGLRFELFVDDVEASVSFYGATLGLVPPENWSPDEVCATASRRCDHWRSGSHEAAR